MRTTIAEEGWSYLEPDVTVKLLLLPWQVGLHLGWHALSVTRASRAYSVRVTSIAGNSAAQKMTLMEVLHVAMS